MFICFYCCYLLHMQIPTLGQFLEIEPIFSSMEMSTGDKCGFRKSMNDMLLVCQTVLRHEARKDVGGDVQEYHLDQVAASQRMQSLLATKVGCCPRLRQLIRLKLNLGDEEVYEEVQRNLTHFIDGDSGRLVIAEGVREEAVRQLCRELLLPVVRVELAQVTRDTDRVSHQFI